MIILTEDDNTTVGKDNCKQVLTLLMKLNIIIALITTLTS